MMSYLSERNILIPSLLYSLFLHAALLYLFLTLPLIRGINYTGAFEIYFVHLRDGEGNAGKAPGQPLLQEKNPGLVPAAENGGAIPVKDAVAGDNVEKGREPALKSPTAVTKKKASVKTAAAERKGE